MLKPRRFFLLIALLLATATLARGDAIDLMLANPGIQSPYINEYLDGLLDPKPVDPALAAAIGWPWDSREELDLLGAELQGFLPKGGTEPMAIRLDVREYNHRKHGRGFFLIGVLHTEGEAGRPIALIARSFRRSPVDGAVEVWGDGLRIDHTAPAARNLIFPILNYLDSIYARVGVSRERLVADWRGRFYWTGKSEYDFDPDYRFRVNGRDVDQLTVARDNFQRFLSLHQVPLAELLLPDGEAGWKAVAGIGDFRRPQDFARVKHPTRKLQVATLTDVDVREALSKPLEVGLAFTLSDYTMMRHTVTPVQSCSGFLTYNDTAMPPWRALRRLR